MAELAGGVRAAALVFSFLVVFGPAFSGCLLRGNVELWVAHPFSDAWTPAGLLEAAIEAAGGDAERTEVRQFGAIFSEDSVLKVLDLKIRTEPKAGGDPYYVDFLVGQTYDAASDRVLFRGFRHDALDVNDRPHPAREWSLDGSILDALNGSDFGQLADPAGSLAGATFVLDVRFMPECAPHASSEGDWNVWRATDEGLVSAGATHELRCYTSPRLPPTALVTRHVPCIRGPECPEGTADAFLVDYGAGD